MTTASIPPVLVPVLVKLRSYMHGFYPDEVQYDDAPLAFWELADDDVFYESLGYLPLFMGDLEDRLDSLPPGFRLAYPIFHLEDDYQFNGWTALGNAGEGGLARAAAAYRHIGMASEAAALEAARLAVMANPDDEAAHECAYKSVPNAYQDDELKNETLLAWFRGAGDLFVSSGL